MLNRDCIYSSLGILYCSLFGSMRIKCGFIVLMEFFLPKALDRGGALLKVVKLATGHNAIDMVGTILLNILRGDIARYFNSKTIFMSITFVPHLGYIRLK